MLDNKKKAPQPGRGVRRCQPQGDAGRKKWRAQVQVWFTKKHNVITPPTVCVREGAYCRTRLCICGGSPVSMLGLGLFNNRYVVLHDGRSQI